MTQNDISEKQTIRFQIIRSMLPEGKTHDEIASACGVSRSTIDRDLAEWRYSEDYLTWLSELVITLTAKVANLDPGKALDNVMKIVVKDMVLKIDQRLELEAKTNTRTESLNELLQYVPPEQRTQVVNGLRAIWRSKRSRAKSAQA
jgi:hypothetical protein